MSWQWLSIITVWVLTTLGGILVATLAPRDEYFTWVPIVLAAAVILTFCIQLAIQRKEGFVARVMASIGVSVLILAILTGVLSIVG